TVRKFIASQIRDDHYWTTARQTQLVTTFRSIDKSGRCDEVHAFGKGAFALRCDHEYSLCQNRNLTGATTTGQTHYGTLIVSDDSCVEITEPIDLNALQKSHVDESALQK